MHNLAFLLQFLSLSCFIVFAAMAILKHMRDDDLHAHNARMTRRVSLALRQGELHPGRRVKNALEVLEAKQ